MWSSSPYIEAPPLASGENEGLEFRFTSPTLAAGSDSSTGRRLTDEGDPLSCDPALDMYDERNGWAPWPEPSSYDPAWLARYREAQLARVARIDAVARQALAERDEAAGRIRSTERGTMVWNHLRRRAVLGRYLTIYRTLADPAYLDLSIDPDDRPMGSIFAFPDPLDGNYGSFGVGRTLTPRAWLSTWSGLSSHASMAASLPDVRVPTLIVHPSADTEIRRSQAQEYLAVSGAADKTYVEVPGAPHYLHGRRQEAITLVVDWLRSRVPT
jgi:pimeloyl-ACP methyl ester carboxylesterase